jgi:acid phosphatase family membrane protein YuiD
MFAQIKILELFSGLFANEHFRIALVSMLLAQILKIFFYYLRFKKLNFRVFVQSSGMPSSHTAMVMALSTSVGITEGWDSVAFAIAMVFSLIVMYDAAGVRRAAGKQAKVLNVMMEDFFTKKKIEEYRLKELLGHTPLEVIFGALLGMTVAFMYHVTFRLF